ncbi:hypothetical protein HMPREF1380_02492, partial [Enterococcus faecium R499]
MKRLGLFWLILLLVIVAFYMEPVLFPPKLEVKENSDQQISALCQMMLVKRN